MTKQIPSLKLPLRTAVLPSLAASVLMPLIASLALSTSAGAADPAGTAGQFWRVYWYESGYGHTNAGYDPRFRVNSPEVVLHPEFGKRSEARDNGLMLILAEEDLSLLTKAELYLETWGGHPGVINKRFTVNGRTTYYLPRVGSEELNCTYSYPATSLNINDLVNGYNAFQFALDQGSTFWGHMIVDNACLRVGLTNSHPDLARAGLGNFRASVKVAPLSGGQEGFDVSLDCPDAAKVESVDFQGFYFGYDENGNLQNKDWHGFTKGRLPMAILASVTNAPFQTTWSTTMLPAQSDVMVRATLHFKDQTNLFYITTASPSFKIAERTASQVTLYSSHGLPKGFWSRANQKQKCTIYLDVAPDRIEKAELHVNTWTGGAGTVKNYFTLNGHPFPVAEGAHHELMYSRIEVSREFLKQGINEIELLSDTEHHGIEIPLPGPCLMVRSSK